MDSPRENDLLFYSIVVYSYAMNSSAGALEHAVPGEMAG